MSTSARASVKPPKLLYLEGMRGVAAWTVVVHHFLLTFYQVLTDGRWDDVAAVHPGLLWLCFSPFNLLFNGHFAVMLFFVHSGLVLSLKFTRRPDDRIVYESALKRYVRLMPPVLASCLIAYVLMVVGAMQSQPAAAAISGNHWLLQQYGFDPHWWDSLYQGLVKYFLFIVPVETSFDSSLWSIGTEFWGSLFLFGVLFVAGRIWSRRWWLYGFMLLVWFRKHYLCFALGICLAEWVVAEEHGRVWVSAWSRRLRSWIGAGMLLVGAYLACIKQGSIVLHPYLTRIDGKYIEDFEMIGAFLMIGGLMQVDWLKRILENRFFQKLGHLSYSVYVLHVLVLASVGCWAFLLVLRVASGPSSYGLATFAAAVATIAGTWVSSEMLRRWIDLPSIRWANRFGAWALVKVGVVPPPELRTEVRADNRGS